MIPLLWIDLETTGLDPEKDIILEVAAVATNNRLLIEGKYHAIVRLEDQDKISCGTLDMHTANGLLKDCRGTDALSLVYIGDCLQEWIRHGIGGTLQNRVLAGSNPAFDRAFLKKRLPDVERLLHYRSFDVNTLWAFFGYEKSASEATHRAMDDIKRDLNITRICFKQAFPEEVERW